MGNAQMVISTNVNTCTHTYRDSNPSSTYLAHHFPRLHSENGFMNLYSRSGK